MIANSAAAAATRNIEAFNAGDFDALRELCTPSVVYTETGTGRVLEGMDACEPVWRDWRVAMPDLAGTVVRSLDDGDLGVIEIAWRGTQTGPLQTPSGPIPPSGNTVEIRSTQWVTTKDGRTDRIDHHLDVMGILAQIGALPG